MGRKARKTAKSRAQQPARPQSAAEPVRPVAGARLYRQLHRLAHQRPLLVVLILVVIHLGFSVMTLEPRPHTGGDNAAYVTLARSMLEHGTYTELWDPAEPPHTKYPPVFPTLLAIGMVLGLTPWVKLKAVVVLCSVLAVAFSFLWIRARGRPLLALGVASIIAIAPGVLNEGHWLLSDVPFWAFTMVALWAFERLRPDDHKRFAIAAIATLFAYFTRSAGLPLALAALGWLAWRRHWKQFGMLAVIIGVPALLWMLRARAFGPSGYVSEFWLIDPYVPALGRIGVVDLLERIISNDRKYMSIHLPMLLTGAQGVLLFVLSGVIFVLAVFGWAWRVRRARVAELFLPLYLGLVFIWPAVWSGERFLLPALPVLLFLAGEALVRMLRRFVPRMTFALPAVVAVLLVLIGVPGLVRATQIARECTSRYQAGDRYPCVSPAYDEYFTLAEEADAMLPDSAIVITRKPRLFYGLGGVQGVTFPLSQDPAAFFATVDSVGARYLIFDQIDAAATFYVRPVILRFAPAFCIMRAQQGTLVFGISTDHASVPDAGEAVVTDDPDISFISCGAEYWRSEQAKQIYSGQVR